jgi:hypothetical protein
MTNINWNDRTLRFERREGGTCMRPMTAVLSVAAIVLSVAGVVAQTRPSFAGEWKKVAEGGQGEPGVDLIITQGAAAMTIEDPRGTLAPARVKLTFKLDGSVSKNTVAGQGGGAPTEQVSKAIWAGNSIVVTTTTGAGEEKRTFSMADDVLVVETSAPSGMFSTRSVTKLTYKRYERGGGG